MPDLVREQPQLASDISAVWFVKRAIMAILILSFSIGGIAWLLHASIDTSLEARAAELSPVPGGLSQAAPVSLPR